MKTMNTINMAIQWHITSNCPNRCKHCYMHTEDIEKIKAEEPDLGRLLEIYETIHDFEKKYNVSIKNYILTGGDPFAASCFKEFAHFLKQHGKSISILSIPEAVTDENIRFMQEIDAAFFQMSLDGCERIHDLIRGQGSYAKTFAALKRLDGTGVPAGIMYTIHQKNKDDMFDVIDALDALDVELVFSFDLLVEEGQAAKSDVCQMLDDRQANAVFERYISKTEEFRVKGSKVRLTVKNNILALKALSEQEVSMADNVRYSYCTGCYAGFSAVGILPNGDFTPCRRLGLVTGNLHKETFEYLLLGEEMMRKMRRPSYYAYCGDCKYWKICRGCMALANSFHKDPFAKNPYCSIKETVAGQDGQYHYPAMDCSDEQEWEMICNTRNNRMLMAKSAEDIRQFCLECL